MDEFPEIFTPDHTGERMDTYVAEKLAAEKLADLFSQKKVKVDLPHQITVKGCSLDFINRTIDYIKKTVAGHKKIHCVIEQGLYKYTQGERLRELNNNLDDKNIEFLPMVFTFMGPNFYEMYKEKQKSEVRQAIVSSNEYVVKEEYLIELEKYLYEAIEEVAGELANLGWDITYKDNYWKTIKDDYGIIDLHISRAKKKRDEPIDKILIPESLLN